jgi:hypothetical protein
MDYQQSSSRSARVLARDSILAWAAAAALCSGAAGADTREAERIVSGLAGGSGSTIGPGGALYVPEPGAGRIARVDPRTGEVETYATGLPPLLPQVGIGGAMDIEFIGSTAYVLVTLVGPDVGGSDTVGIYRMEGPSTFEVFADIGEFSLANPPDTDFFVPTGVQYALEKYRNQLIVTDGHHNRVLKVSRDGDVSELITFGNIVPTGLAVIGPLVFMTQAGPVPHEPEDGKVIAFGPWRHSVWEVASGAPLLVDVELGKSLDLFALSQGTWNGVAEGSPALPFTGALVEAKLDGSFRIVADELNIPTSMEIIGDTAYVVSLVGEIWKIEDISSQRGKRR